MIVLKEPAGPLNFSGPFLVCEEIGPVEFARVVVSEAGLEPATVSLEG